MIDREKDIAGQAEKALRFCLDDLPTAKLRSLRQEVVVGHSVVDFIAEVETPLGLRTLVVQVKGNGQPRFAREVVNRLVRLIPALPGSAGVFMAPYVSPRSAQICRADGVGFIDFAGNCLLAFDSIYIERKGTPNPYVRKSDLGSLYKPRAARILRVLLDQPKRSWRLKDLGAEAQVSLGQTANVKKLLLDREWIVANQNGLFLCDPEALLSEWSGQYSFRKNAVRSYYSMRSIPEIEVSLAGVNVPGPRCLLTGFSAAARYAASVRYQRVMAYIEGPAEEVVNRMGLKEAASGANVLLLEPYDDGLLYGARETDGTWVVSPQQAYLDLVGYKGRGEEAAETLLEKVLRPAW